MSSYGELYFKIDAGHDNPVLPYEISDAYGYIINRNERLAGHFRTFSPG
jgi:hypothetical protein